MRSILLYALTLPISGSQRLGEQTANMIDCIGGTATRLHRDYQRSERRISFPRCDASTLYKAVAQALASLRGHEFVGEICKGLTTATVRVRQPEVTHVIRMQDFETWLNRNGRTPAEIVLKDRLRQMLGMCER